MGLPFSTRRLLRRLVLAMVSAQAAVIASLMTTTKVRKIIRGHHVAPLDPQPAVSHAIGDGSTATTYTYGAILFDDMIAAIDSAQHRVLLETFIIKGDAVGKRFKTALIEASLRGVDVYVIYDGFANLLVRASFQFFNPRRLGRDHRKLLVIDDAVGFVGGYNIGAAYATEWRDTHLRVEGPAVWDLDNAFIDFWNARCARGAPTLEQYRPAGWQPQIRAHRNVPRQLMYPIRGMYLEAIDRAHSSIDITAAYFIPDRDILDALLNARGRGVVVRILVPKVSNHVVTDWLSRGFYGRLLSGGVEIHRYAKHMVHAKTATIDGQWTTIGTANIDRLSLLGNYEINLEILAAGLAQGMREIFEIDRLKCEELTLEAWMNRPLLARAYEAILRPLGPLL